YLATWPEMKLSEEPVEFATTAPVQNAAPIQAKIHHFPSLVSLDSLFSSCSTTSELEEFVAGAGRAMTGGTLIVLGVSSVGLDCPGGCPIAVATTVCGVGTGGGMIAPRTSLKVFHSARPVVHANVPSLMTPAFSIASTCSFEKAPSCRP